MLIVKFQLGHLKSVHKSFVEAFVIIPYITKPTTVVFKRKDTPSAAAKGLLGIWIVLQAAIGIEKGG